MSGRREVRRPSSNMGNKSGYYHLTTEMTFDAAHRLSGYSGKCHRLHGHTYRVIVEIRGKKLNDWGGLLDLGNLKQIMKERVDEKYDHRTILMMGDPINMRLADSLPEANDWVVWMGDNTTAENLARDIFEDLEKAIKAWIHGIDVVQVTIYETPKSAATYKR